MNLRRSLLSGSIGLVCCLLLPLPMRPAGTRRQAWTDRGAAFSAGTLGNSGQNLYVNRRGELETIRRFDVDGDGHLDLLFNSGHDLSFALRATLVRAAPGQSLQLSELGVDGSTSVIPYDLNRDGFTDLVFMPNRQNIQYARRSSLIIAWGGPDGWSTARLTRQVPVYGVFGAEDSLLPDARLAVGDLNGDGWPDILTLNSEAWLREQGQGRILRIYSGGPDGFSLTHYQDLGIPRAIEVVAGGFGPQRKFCAAVLTSTGAVHYLAPDAKGTGLHVARTVQLPVTTAAGGSPMKLQCLLAQPGAGTGGDTLWIGTDSSVLFQVGPTAQEDEVKSITAQPATHLALGRLDNDPWPDLVLTNLKLIFPSDKIPPDPTSSVTILWGGADGVSAGRSTSLSIPNAISTAVGDLDGDGNGDLLVAVHQGDKSMKASSRVYFGDGSRRLPTTNQLVPTEGAQGVAIARLTPQTRPLAVFANSMYFTLDSAVPARLYWGSADGFSPKAMVEIPNLGGLKSSLSDLNSDGYVDLILVNGGDVGENTISRAPYAGANIYWGGAEGSIRGPGPTRFDPARRTILREPHLCAINVADLNGDGYLDIVLGAYEGGKPNNETDLVIYYGSAAGFPPENRKTVRMQGRGEGCLIADLNRDGQLDIIVTHLYGNQIVIYWGGAGQYSEKNKAVLPYPAADGLEAADLNNDGWLDLIVGTYYDPVTHSRDTGMSIFWGGPQGYHQSNSQWLPGLAADSLAAADVDGDGYLDIVVPNYHGELQREDMPSYVYWGSASGYTTRNRTSLPVNSACDVMIADFNQDGKLDLAFTAHSVNTGHLISTPIFYNDGNRFEAPRVQYLPVIGPFYGWVQDIGNIYHRRYEETFVSRVFTWKESSSGGRLTVDAATRGGSRVGLYVRSAADETALASAPWCKISGDSFEFSAADRALQYRLDLQSANGDAYPVVRKVDLVLK